MKRLLAILLILVIGTVFTACDSGSSSTDDKSMVNIYYINTKTSGMVTEKYKLISTKTEDRIHDLLYMLKKSPKNLVYKSVMPDALTYKYNMDKDNTLTIDFDSTYNDMEEIPEVLCRAAIVKTLSQIDGIDFIQFYVDGSTLILNGDVVGPMTAEDFIDNTESNTNYKIKLYFANKAGNGLLEYDTDINYTGTTSLEELAIEQLINGPTEMGMYNTIPEGTVLLNISKNDGVCTVDFNEKFLEKLANIKDEEVTIYSVVNTLVELPDINKVQFTINSQTVETFWDDLKLDGMFERNIDLIKTTE